MQGIEQSKINRNRGTLIMEKEIAKLIRKSDDIDLAFIHELWEILKPEGTEKERKAFFELAGFL